MISHVITEEQSDALRDLLSDVMATSKADAVYICDWGGNIIDHVTKMEGRQDETIAALAAGSFAATGELAKLLGEPTFHYIFHRGQGASIYMQNLGHRFLILVIFGATTTLGMVKLYVEKSAQSLENVLHEMTDQTLQSSGTKTTFSMKHSEDVFKRKT